MHPLLNTPLCFCGRLKPAPYVIEISPAIAENVYRLASVSKSFVSVLMLSLVEEGIVKLDDPVTKYVPEIMKIDNEPGYASQITLRQLACHISGLSRAPGPVKPDKTPIMPFGKGNISDWEKQLIASFSETKFNSKPGEKYAYSNTGYGILGLALARATKKPFPDLIKKHVLDPLQMNDTGYVMTDEMLAKLAYGLGTQSRSEHETGRGWKVPSGGLYSTVEDLSKYIGALSSPDNNKILSQKSLEAILSPQSDLLSEDAAKYKSEIDKSISYGFGFFIYIKENNLTTYGHRGSIAGYRCYICFEPKSKIGVILLRNYRANSSLDYTKLGQEMLVQLIESQQL